MPQDEQQHILAEAGTESFSFIYYTKDPFKVNGACVYDFSSDESPLAMQANFDKIGNDNKVYFGHALSVRILLNVKESTLVPGTFYNDEDKEAALNLLFGEDKNAVIFTDTEIGNTNPVTVYRTHHRLSSALNRQFPGAAFTHSTSVQLNSFSFAEGSRLHCIVYHRMLKIILYKQGKLQLAQYFSYGTPDDAVYHLLNVCAQYEITPADTDLFLYGLIDEKSNLYNEIYKYFTGLSFAPLPSGTQLSQELVQYPPQFFSHLIIAAACGS